MDPQDFELHRRLHGKPKLAQGTELMTPSRKQKIQEAARTLCGDASDAEKAKAAHTVMVIAERGDETKAAIAEAGAIPPLVALLKDGGGAKYQSAWALAALAADNPANKASIAQAGAIPPLVALVKEGGLDAKKPAAALYLTLGLLSLLSMQTQAYIKNTNLFY